MKQLVASIRGFFHFHRWGPRVVNHAAAGTICNGCFARGHPAGRAIPRCAGRRHDHPHHVCVNPAGWCADHSLRPGRPAARHAVVATDYPLGRPGRARPCRHHPGAAPNSVRAAGRLPGRAAGQRLAVRGHSQGGHAALFTAARPRVCARVRSRHRGFELCSRAVCQGDVAESAAKHCSVRAQAKYRIDTTTWRNAIVVEPAYADLISIFGVRTICSED
jgi:hypothetical protein